MRLPGSELGLFAFRHALLTSRLRSLVRAVVAGIELEMRDALGDSLVDFGLSVLNKSLSYGPLKRDPEWFNDDENVRQPPAAAAAPACLRRADGARPGPW